ncbi:hypothetical protein OSTOST_18741 [Ostertagia ostertagi]
MAFITNLASLAQSSLEFRVHLRCEFLMLGMASAATLIRPQASNRLQDHLDLFEMMRKEDEIVLSGGNSEDSGASSPVNFESASDIAEALHSKLRSSPALPHFMSLLQHLFMTQKRVPKPSGPLKSFNWIKLTESKVKGTAWEFIEDEKMYKQLDLEDVASTFASSSQKEEDTDFYSTISRRTRDTQVSVIDPRRYQNCTIMLSKLKLSHREIRTALLAMDDKGKLPKDMLEQMLKFVPSKEEVTLLRSAVNRHSSPSVLALADRYLYEMAQIPRFEPRLRSLYIIRTFQERFDCLTPHIQSVTKASSAISSSKKFKQLLALVLALGNHLNYGKRNGNAFGFGPTSLNRLSDVKFSHRSDRTLLHYVLQVVENRLPDLGKLRRELAASQRSSWLKFAVWSKGSPLFVPSWTFMKEGAHQEQLNQDPTDEEWKKDRFEAVAKQFVATACEQYHTLEKQHSEMKAKFSACAAQFCFDTLNPEEMFSCLAKFLTAFCDAQQQLWTENEQKEQVKRQTIARSYFAKKACRRRENERDFDQLISALQSGDLFKDDLSRLRTSLRVPKKSRDWSTAALTAIPPQTPDVDCTSVDDVRLPAGVLLTLQSAFTLF